jgi:hypothetical protein
MRRATAAMRPDERALRRLSAVVAIVSLALVATALLCTAIEISRGWLPLDQAGVAQILIGVWILALSFPLLGWVILRRLPSHRLGWIYLAIGFWEALNLFASGYSTLAFWLTSGDLPLASELSWVAVWAWAPAFTLFSSMAILLFPTGHLPSRRWWPVVGLAALSLVLLLVPTAALTWPYRGLTLERANALNVPPPPDPSVALAFAIQNVAQLLLLVAMIGSAAALVARFRRARGVERQQLKWFTYGAILVVVLLVVWTANVLDPLASALSALLLAVLPVAIAIAILRYRLFDIDRIISRTVSYAILTAVLAGVYVAGFLGFQAALSSVTESEGPVAVAASTLAVFALFTPIRRRIQAVVDRRFNRARYDAQQSAEAFAGRIRDQVDLGQLSAEVVQVLERTVQPASAGIWLRPSERVVER